MSAGAGAVPPTIYERMPNLQDEAAYYNKDPILGVLRSFLSPEVRPGLAPAAGAHVLEIASGSGQHAAFFVQQLPAIAWILPTEYDEAMLPVISKVAAQQIQAHRVLPPRRLDVSVPASWDDIFRHAEQQQCALDGAAFAGFDAALVTNLCHISPWETTVGLMEGLARVLVAGALVFIYGPFLRDGKFTTASNERFDLWLKHKDPRFGLRDIQALAEIAPTAFTLRHVEDMPENNFMLVFQKRTA